jgi:hypothetical protein
LVSYLFNARPALRFAGGQSDKHHVRRRVNAAKAGCLVAQPTTMAGKLLSVEEVRSAADLTNLNRENVMGRGILLWLLGVPIPIIIICCSYSITDQRRARVRTLAVHKDQREATGSPHQ